MWGNLWTDLEDPGEREIALGKDFSYTVNVHRNTMYLTFTSERLGTVRHRLAWSTTSAPRASQTPPTTSTATVGIRSTSRRASTTSAARNPRRISGRRGVREPATGRSTGPTAIMPKLHFRGSPWVRRHPSKRCLFEPLPMRERQILEFGGRPTESFVGEGVTFPLSFTLINGCFRDRITATRMTEIGAHFGRSP